MTSSTTTATATATTNSASSVGHVSFADYECIRAALVSKEEKLAKKEEELTRVTKAYENLLVAYERMRRQLFGQKAERLSPEQQAFAWALAVAEVGGAGAEFPPPPSTDPRKRKKPRPHGRRNLEEIDLPVETIELLPPALPEGAVRIGEDATYRIEHQRARLVKVKLVRPIFKVPTQGEIASCDDFSLLQCDTAHEMIPKGLLGPGLLAHLFVSKWVDHIPFHRQERIFARQGIALDRTTMCRAAKACAELAKGVIDACWKDARQNALVFATDATGVLVQQLEVCRRGHFFVAIADDDYVFFHFTPKHNHHVPIEMFEGFSGYLQADASSVYDALYRESSATEVGCWAHCRRKFFEAVREERDTALTGIGFIQALFAFEKEANETRLPPQKRLALRRARAGPILREFFDWCEKQSLRLGKDRSLLGRAVRYALRQREALSRFQDDARLKLTNNRSERELRSIAVGRHNWLFVGSDDHAEASAVLISLVASCRIHRLDPETYLRDLFRVLPQWPASRQLELAPRFWAWTRDRLVPAELAAPYGDLTIPPLDTLPTEKNEHSDHD